MAKAHELVAKLNTYTPEKVRMNTSFQVDRGLIRYGVGWTWLGLGIRGFGD